MTDPSSSGWHSDPTGRHQYRYVTDGQWTDHVADNDEISTDPLNPPPAPSAGPSATAASTPSARPVIGFTITAFGALFTLVGAFLPWVTVKLGGFEVTVAGTEGDGVITIVVAIVAATFGIVMLGTRARGLAAGVLVSALIIALVALNALRNVADSAAAASTLSNDPFLGGVAVEAKAGIGLWVTLVSSLFLLAGGLLGLARK